MDLGRLGSQKWHFQKFCFIKIEKIVRGKNIFDWFSVFLKIREKGFLTRLRTSKSVHGARRNRRFKLVSKSKNSLILIYSYKKSIDFGSKSVQPPKNRVKNFVGFFAHSSFGSIELKIVNQYYHKNIHGPKVLFFEKLIFVRIREYQNGFEQF